MHTPRKIEFAMFRSLVFVITLALTVLFQNCSKESLRHASPGIYKIIAESGDNQTDTIGNTLREKIVFKATYDNDTVKNGFIRIEVMDCDDAVVFEEFRIGNQPYSYYTLQVPFEWTLNGIVGKQHVKAILMDSLRVPQDSVIVTAHSVGPGKGWYRSGCVPVGKTSISFARLPSGRILTAYNKVDHLYYSDDEGASWRALTTLPDKYAITRIIATEVNEVFVGISGVGMFYSADGGAHWENRSNGLPETSYGEIEYTRSGQLFVFTGEGVHTSNDKGLHWFKIPAGLLIAGFWDAASTSDGTLFAVHDHHIFRSTSGGQSWGSLYTITSVPAVSLLFIDDNDDIYAAFVHNSIYGLHVSKDKGDTWTRVYTPQPAHGFDPRMTSMIKHKNQYYFYASGQNVLLRTSDFVNYTTLNPPEGSGVGRKSLRYIVTENERCLLAVELYGLYYWVP